MFYRCKIDLEHVLAPVKLLLEVLYHHAKFGWAGISPAAVVAKNVEFFLSVCLSVCLFVTLLNVTDCAPDFP